MERENKDIEVKQFTNARTVSPRGRGVLRPLAVQLAVCAAAAAALTIMYFASPSLFDQCIRSLLEAAGQC